MIKPTIGRKVWYWPSELDKGSMSVRDNKQPLDATIVFVATDNLVNLCVLDHIGRPFCRPEVLLLQVQADADEIRPFAEWMPYQKGQAAKTEQLQEKLNQSGPGMAQGPQAENPQQA